MPPKHMSWTEISQTIGVIGDSQWSEYWLSTDPNDENPKMYLLESTWSPKSPWVKVHLCNPSNSYKGLININIDYYKENGFFMFISKISKTSEPIYVFN